MKPSLKTREYYEDLEIKAAMEKQMEEENVRPEIMLHKGTNNTFREWGKNDLVDLFYTPTPGDPFEVIDEQHVKMQIAEGSSTKVGFWYDNVYLGAKKQREFDEAEKYKIPPEKVDEIFDLIETGADPKDIVVLLQ